MQNYPDDEQLQDFSDTEKFWVRVTLYKLVYAISGLVMGITCIVVGVILVLSKLTGSTIETVSRSDLISVTPWIVLFIIGFFVIVVTRYSKLSAKHEHFMIERDFAPRSSISHRLAQEAASKRFWKTVNTFSTMSATVVVAPRNLHRAKDGKVVYVSIIVIIQFHCFLISIVYNCDCLANVTSILIGDEYSH